MVDDATRGTRAAAGDATRDEDPAAYDSTAPGSQALTGEAATIVPTWGASTFASLPDPGYQIGELIGRGGMGEVVAAHDQRIGREVAIKRMRARDPTPTRSRGSCARRGSRRASIIPRSCRSTSSAPTRRAGRTSR